MGYGVFLRCVPGFRQIVVGPLPFDAAKRRLPHCRVAAVCPFPLPFSRVAQLGMVYVSVCLK